MTRTTVTRYSEAFKVQVVADIEKGQLTMAEARKKYGIKGSHTVKAWLKRYGREALLPRIVRIEKMDERDRLKQLEKEKQALESALAQAHLRIVSLESMIDIADEQLGTNIKKNPAYKALKKSDKAPGAKKKGGRST